MKAIFKIIGFMLLQFASFSIFMSATGDGSLLKLTIAPALGILSYCVFLKKRKYSN